MPTPKKKTATKKKSVSTVKKSVAKPSVDLVEQVCDKALAKLKALKSDEPLQADLAWCLGSYRHDRNPSGLFLMAERALVVFKNLKKENAKAVPVTLITQLEKVLATR
jgi:hypothetical protein